MILARPSEKNKGLFLPYEQEAGIAPVPGKGVVQNNGFKIIWGDATAYEDVTEAIQGADWVLDAIAFISPQADYYPEIAKAVNTDAIANIVQAIEAQPNGADRIRLIYTGTVAETGGRLGSIHWGRVGDPLKPSIFDYYAVTKIAGERAVLESNIMHWASLHMTFIMPTDYADYASLSDPIMFHQPLNSLMENLTDRDAGVGLVNCLDIADDSDSWRRVYNMGGGPAMRCTAYDYSDTSFKNMGLSGMEACTERNWFALRNFHMQYFEDSDILNGYLHHWRDSMENFWKVLHDDRPAGLKALIFVCRYVPFVRKKVEEATYGMMQEMAEQLTLPDLQGAAGFRGGECLSETWDGDMSTTLAWKCALGHEFTGRPNTILKAGHCCPVCVAPPWDYDAEDKLNPFFAQVWYPNHDEDEFNFYPEELCQGIAGADRDDKQ